MYLAIQIKYTQYERTNPKCLNTHFINDPIVLSEVIKSGDFIVYKLDSLQQVKNVIVTTTEVL